MKSGSIRRHLEAGGVIAYPTESCYGLGCYPESLKAVARLLEIKKRPQSRGLILIAGKFRQIERYIAHPPRQDSLAKYWPGPYTLLLRASIKVPKWVKGRHDKIALRVTAHKGAAKLCNMLGRALVSTSANRSGMRPAKSYRECARRFGGSVMVIPGRIGKRKNPSTILDFETGKVLRA
jgi:L-threonylcarbamoyladenylate synthase